MLSNPFPCTCLELVALSVPAAVVVTIVGDFCSKGQMSEVNEHITF